MSTDIRNPPGISILCITFTFGLILGSYVTIKWTMLPSVAPWYSQAIYDCAIRIADEGVSGGEITGFRIEGHHFGLCAPMTIWAVPGSRSVRDGEKN
jgi:hypothetical protein